MENIIPRFSVLPRLQGKEHTFVLTKKYEAMIAQCNVQRFVLMSDCNMVLFPLLRKTGDVIVSKC